MVRSCVEVVPPPRILENGPAYLTHRQQPSSVSTADTTAVSSSTSRVTWPWVSELPGIAKVVVLVAPVATAPLQIFWLGDSSDPLTQIETRSFAEVEEFAGPPCRALKVAVR